MVERLMASWAYWLTRLAARSSRLQRVAGRSWAAVASEARAMTSTCRSGGKAAGATRPGGILQASEAVRGVAAAPQADGVAVATDLGGDAAVGGPVGFGGPEDEAAAEGQRLRGGVGAAKGE